MRNKLIRVLLALLLAAVIPLSAAAQEDAAQPAQRTLSITTAKQFLDFAENCRLDSYSWNLAVTLKADIDLTGLDFTGVPIFCGTFEGNGHSISGLDIRCDGSSLGLFRYIGKDAAVRNLKVSGTLEPDGSRQYIGGIAGRNEGTLENCAFSGSVSGSDHVGGIAGINAVTGIITDSTSDGLICGNHFVGGIAGTNSGVIRQSANTAGVNTTPQQNTVGLSDITMESMTGSESVNTVTDIGGIAGSSGGVIRDCSNEGQIGYTSMGYNVGGIAGSQIGFLTGCKNTGSIQGRKEVGGIAGQAEPATKIHYTKDTLQILQGQLNTMGSLAGRAAANAQSGASDVSDHMVGIQDSILDAEDALYALTEEELDPDTFLAAEGILTDALSSIESDVSGAASALYDTVGTLSSDMQALTRQVNAMQQTIGNADQNLGGEVTDISDLDTPEDTSAKISFCENYGSITADANCGGIAGAISPENDLDLEEDLQIVGHESLNFDGELRCVIRDCTNSGTVSAAKQYGGGIVGAMTIGLVKDCVNTGSVTGEKADYLGGIAGQSAGFLRSSSAKCEVTGNQYVGGIAGQADTVTDCRSMVKLSASERYGAVIGYSDLSLREKTGDGKDERPAVSGNFYTPIGKDPGAVDGISYDTLAQPLVMEDFLTLENLPRQLGYFTVRFIFASGTEKTANVLPGEALKETDIPNLAIMDGRNSHWENLSMDPIPFDCTIRAAYDPLVPVLELRDSGTRARILAEGAFLPDARLEAEPIDANPPLEAGSTLVESLRITLPESETDILVRYLLPEGIDPQRLTVVRQDDSCTGTLPFQVDGSYIVFSGEKGTGDYSLIQQKVPVPKWALPAAALAAGVLLLLLYRRKKAASKKNP